MLDHSVQFPAFAGRPLFLSGESYAGKYVPWLGSQILTHPNPALALTGLAIGDGWTAPLTQTETVGPQAFQLGLIDANELDAFDAMLRQCSALVAAEEWAAAQVECDAIDTFVVNASGGINIDDVRQFGDDDKDDRLVDWLNAPATQQALGVSEAGVTWAECSGPVAAALATDEMKPAVQLLPALLANYRVLLYNGNFDLNCGATGTELYLRRMQWPGSAAYLSAPKHIWTGANGNVTAGYVRTALNLTQLIVMHAGHLVPKTQPAHAFDMIDRFVNNRPFY